GDRAAEPGTRVRVAARERNGGGGGEAPRESVCVSDRAAEPEALAQLRRRGFGLAAVQVDHREVSEAARYPVRVADGAIALERAPPAPLRCATPHRPPAPARGAPSRPTPHAPTYQPHPSAMRPRFHHPRHIVPASISARSPSRLSQAYASASRRLSFSTTRR